MTPGLLNSCRSKQRLFSKKIKNPNERNKLNFSNFNKLLNKVKRAAKKSYYSGKFSEYSKNIKKKPGM